MAEWLAAARWQSESKTPPEVAVKLTHSILLIGGFLILGIVSGPHLGSHRKPVQLKTETPHRVEPTPDAKSESRINRVLSSLLETQQLKQRHALFLAIGDLSSADLAGLMERAEKLPGQYRSKVMEAAIDRWLELDSAAAMPWIRAHPSEQVCWVTWARHRPEEVLKEVHANLWLPWARSMFDAAITQLAGSNLKAQQLAMMAMPSDRFRDDYLETWFNDWSGEEPAAALAAIQNANKMSEAGSVRSFFAIWMHSNPLLAAESIDSILPHLEIEPVTIVRVANLAATLAEKGIDGALQWASRLPAEFQDAALRRAAGVWASAEPADALEWCVENGIDLVRLDNDFDSDFPGSSVIEMAMEHDAGWTVGWILSQPPSPDRDATLERALRTRSRAHPESAYDANPELIIGSMSHLPADAQERIAYSLGLEINSSDHLKRLRFWSDRLPDGPIRAAMIEGAARWNQPDTQTEILDLFPDPVGHDAVLSGIAEAQAVEKFNLKKAAQTALDIGNPVIRRDVLEGIIPSWLQSAPEEARNWLASTPGLSPKWKAAWEKEKR